MQDRTLDKRKVNCPQDLTVMKSEIYQSMSLIWFQEPAFHSISDCKFDQAHKGKPDQTYLEIWLDSVSRRHSKILVICLIFSSQKCTNLEINSQPHLPFGDPKDVNRVPTTWKTWNIVIWSFSRTRKIMKFEKKGPNCGKNIENISVHYTCLMPFPGKSWKILKISCKIMEHIWPYLLKKIGCILVKKINISSIPWQKITPMFHDYILVY